MANALLLFLINLCMPEPVCSPAQAGNEIDDRKFKLILLLVIFWPTTSAASAHHLMHSLARNSISLGPHAAGHSEGAHTFPCSILPLLWSQLSWEGEMLPGLQQVLAPALAVNSKFLNSYLEQRLRSKRWAVMCRSPEMSWFNMTHLLPSLPHLLTSQVCFKSIFSPLTRLTI